MTMPATEDGAIHRGLALRRRELLVVYVMMITASRSPLWVYPSISSPSFPGASQSTGHDLLGGHPAKAVGGEGAAHLPHRPGAPLALPVLFDVFSHFHLERHLQHPSRPFPDEVLQIRLHFGPDYALHLNCRIFSHERILSPSFSRELWVDWT